MPRWQEAPLERFLTRITYGFTNPMPTTDAGPYMITARDINYGRILYEQARSTSEKAFRNDITDKSRPDVGDVLVTKDGTLGRIAIVDRDGVCINQSVALLKPARNIRSRYLKYLLEEPENFARMLNDADGTTIKHLYITRLARMKVRVPTVEMQDEIIGILGALDDKIDLNRRMNGTLEAMARALFKDWFVDFGPTRAKMEGRPPYLGPEIWRLFPDRLDKEGKPTGWTVRRVEDILELAYGKALKAEDRDGGPVPVYGSGGIAGYHDKSLADGPSIIVGRKGTVGSLYWEDRSFFPIDTVFYVKPKVPLTFCFYHLQTLGLNSMNTDAAVPGLNRNNVYRLPVPWSAGELLDLFDKTVMPFRQRIRANLEERDSLIAIRDILLPKLMSGEIRVEEAEKFAEALA